MTHIQEVTIATYENIPAILEILHNNLFTKKHAPTLQSLENEGFIYFSFSKHDLKSWLDDKDYLVFVCHENDKIVGYAIGCDLDKLTQQMRASFITLLESVGEFAKHKIFYHKQVVTNHANAGIGTLLMKELFKQVKQRGYDHIICVISQQPYRNTKSINFHEKLGFKEIGTIQDHHAIDGFYLKQL